MKTFTEIKNDLLAIGLSSKYFTRSFYADFKQAYYAVIANTINGVDCSYCSGGVWLTHEYDKIYNSDFYKKDGYIYCEFLSSFYSGLTPYKIICAEFKNGYAEVLHTCTRYYDSLSEAEAMAKSIFSEYPIVDVCAC